MPKCQLYKEPYQSPYKSPYRTILLNCHICPGTTFHRALKKLILMVIPTFDIQLPQQGLSRKFVITEHILKSDFQHGGGIILFHEALVKSNLDGLKFRRLRFLDFRNFGFVTDPQGPLFSTLALQKYFKNTREIQIHFKTICFFEVLKSLKTTILKRRAPDFP